MSLNLSTRGLHGHVTELTALFSLLFPEPVYQNRLGCQGALPADAQCIHSRYDRPNPSNVQPIGTWMMILVDSYIVFCWLTIGDLLI